MKYYKMTAILLYILILIFAGKGFRYGLAGGFCASHGVGRSHCITLSLFRNHFKERKMELFVPQAFGG